MPENTRPTAGSKPRVETEIIPPHAGHHAMWVSISERGFYVRQLGPFGVILLALAAGIGAAFLLVLVVGAFLLWIPIVAVVLTVSIISALLRPSFRRLR